MKNRFKFPVVKEGKKDFPTKALCPVCSKNKVWEPHSMAILSAGALLLLDRKEDYWGPSDDMNGYFDLWWHGAHDGGEGENREIDVGVSIIREVQGGQTHLYFCSTKCLRHFLNSCVDELETKIEKEKKADKQENTKRRGKKRS